MPDEAPRPQPRSSLVEVLDALIEGFQVIDRSWRYVYINPAAAAHGRTDVEALIGRTMQECYPGIEDTEMFALLRRSMEERTPQEMVNEFTYPDGRTGWFQLRCQPVPEGVAVLSIDVTEQREALTQLRRAQRLDALGQLAGGIAHDFNNLLTVIQGSTELARQGLPADADAEAIADLEAVATAAERARELTRKLLAFSSHAPVRPRITDPNALVSDLEAMLRRLLPETLGLQVHLAEDPWPVRIDPGALEQVLVNLVLNARDAMPEGGTVTIDTGCTTLDRSHPAACGLEIPRGEYAVLSVADTGPGLGPDTAERIFEPFFTTRDEGTGLGLSTCFGIVRQAEGYMWVYSEPGHGAIFKVYLPRSDASVDTPRTNPPSEPAEAGSARLLVVEDQAEVCAVVQRALEARGYQVTTAATASDALRRVHTDPPYDLVLTDLVLPDRSGVELLGNLRQQQPSLCAVVMSGYAPRSVTAREQVPDDVLLLEKPFTAEGLRRTVRQALDGARAGD